MAPFSVVLLSLLVTAIEMKTLEPEENAAETIEKRAPACYGSLGCFATEGAFGVSLERPLVLTPESPQQIGTVFKLYTREFRTTSQDLQAIHNNNAATTFSHFKVAKTKIVVHGFLDNPAITSWQKDLKDEFLKQDDYNIIVVDWSRGNLPPYTQATANTRVVGAQIAELVKELIRTKGVTAADFHIIGHSLGSHISGYAGERIPGLARITGLDPAGPYFENTDPTVRLDPTDALFVDAIHTDSESLIQFGLGTREPVAHLDFFPNLGRDQPGCTRNPFTQIAEWGLVQGTAEVVACNHFRAIHFFMESVNSPCPFMGYACVTEDDFTSGRCNSCGTAGCAYMGLHADKNIPPRGQSRKIFFTTAAHRPFCQYHLDINVKLSAGTGQTERGQLFAVFTGDKGSTEKIQLNEDPIDFHVGTTYHFKVGTAKDIGNVQSVTLSFTHIAPLLNPFQWDILGLRGPKLYISEVDVDRKEASAVTRLCTGGVSVETDHSIVVTRAC
ncbi:inactive pancreatic lipase-related protein 1-like [Biomphalaria glabrata]|uniref:Inactive pancreatic lipase-related protein 1-like n=1 Tax=Biomphalaria glabrata TaxID=6526 RepID=A0A2C9LA07_BIOGL|nr:inactive pancreatic lipase-related protein 1-like [Biomphalaria glabrata]